MKNLVLYITVGNVFILLLLPCEKLMAQETIIPYTARAYWLDEQNEVYQRILLKIEKKETLSPAEEQYYEDYHSYLKTYFSKLSQEEKDRYFEFKSQWDEERTDKMEEDDSDIMEINRAGIKPGRKFLLSNGLYGLGYGLAIDAIFEIKPPLSVALPILSSGIGLLWPVINPKKYVGINYGTVLLARHGKFIGILHGAALGLLITGDPDNIDNGGKIILGLATAGSIALGELGFRLGKKNNWSEGRISTYRYYSLIGPGLTFAGLVAANVDDARVYGGATLLAGGLSYLYANHIYEKYHFTRGDMLAASSLGLLSTAFGFGFVDISDRWEILVPAFTLAGGTLASHAILKNVQFTSKEGWNINYVTGATSILGLGIAALINPIDHYAYFLIPSTAGMLTWLVMTSSMKINNSKAQQEKYEKWASATFNISPHHYFLNKQLKPSNENKMIGSLPMFSFRLIF